MNWIFLLILLILSSASVSFAEYRVFVLKIENTQIQSSKVFKSTLDPEQYRSIHLLQANEVISYVDTWRCRGSTRDFKPLCPSPRMMPPIQPTAPPQNVQN